MKLDVELTGKDIAGVETCRAGSTHSRRKPALTVKAVIPKNFRRLKWNELVSSGDFVVNNRKGLELWEGPNGFRAHAFVRPIYRATKASRSQTEKP